ncbi:MAG: GIY-YIG nuclease family protein [bacterium]
MGIQRDFFVQIKELPAVPGVYLFKDSTGQIVYIGKAKNLKLRVSSYVQKNIDMRVEAIMESVCSLEHIVTHSELEAMLLEAKLIQSHQPKHNVLLKGGQPFLYILITSPVRGLPEIKLVRNQNSKGTYFGPFIEKMSARKVFDFFIKTFRLKLCGKRIENGCLYYHLGICSGSCKPDFDERAYIERLELAKKALKQGHKKFLEYLECEIKDSNKLTNFEKSKQLHEYLLAFESVFKAIDTKTSYMDDLTYKEIWVLTHDQNALFLFTERDNFLKKKNVFYFPYANLGTDLGSVHDASQDLQAGQVVGAGASVRAGVGSGAGIDAGLVAQTCLEYFLSYYRTFYPAATILVNFEILEHERELAENFLTEWHKRKMSVSIKKPKDGHYANLVHMAAIQAQEIQKREATLALALKRLLKLAKPVHTIDCFDISHTQGTFMVGSCVRFTDGKPDKNKFRHFKIKTVTGQDDYASLREIVARRYKDTSELPDLILIDGGKGQLSSVSDLVGQTDIIALAKREETVFSKNFVKGKILDQTQYASQILMALRDYAHHFAIGYHRCLGLKNTRLKNKNA